VRPRSVRFELTAVPHASREARDAARVVLEDWDVPVPLVDDALLVISELVTNAVRHAGTASTLELELGQTGERLRVALTDGSAAQPRARRAGTAAEDGRGMTILAALSDRWGIEPHQGGKRVWWEVDVGAGYAGGATTRRAKATASA
jgi:anti-sigma regulatory factor (Ser/Thr protein kinase)